MTRNGRLMMGAVFISTALIFAGFRAHAGRTSSATAIAKVVVRSSILIVKNRDLDFGEGFTGDSPLLVPAEAGAKFSVSGEPNRAYSITLPATVTMLNGDGSGTKKQIQVTQFTSNPANLGQLSQNGSQFLYVGATRALIPQSQEAGSYSAAFTVVVAYQ